MNEKCFVKKIYLQLRLLNSFAVYWVQYMCLNNELPSSCVLLSYTLECCANVIWCFVTFWFCSLFILYYALDVFLVPFVRYMMHSVILVRYRYILRFIICWMEWYIELRITWVGYNICMFICVHWVWGVEILWRFPSLAASLVFKWQFTKMEVSSGWWCFLFNLRVSDINSTYNRLMSQAVIRFPVLLEAFFSSAVSATRIVS